MIQGHFGIPSQRLFDLNPFNERRLYYTNLENILRALGGSTTSTFHDLPPGIVLPRVEWSLVVAMKLAIEILESEEKEATLPQVYLLLKPDASRTSLWDDMYQASLMVLLRSKIEIALEKSNLNDRDKCSTRLSLQAFFMTFPIERSWLYLKVSRNLTKFNIDEINNRITDLDLVGKEDKFAKFLAYFPGEREYLVRTMYRRALS
ncbi:hypothetical protein N7451_007765 [Penicillium sp. IBT 35674x]|nr:hypothetical protein N7451_007765 [Penicillium sp. IBT 35674x]